MRRPTWWPDAWPWPGGRGRSGAAELPDAPAAPGPDDPVVTFLRALVEALGADRASLFRLEREEGAWRVERSVADAGAPPGGRGASLPAAGHPLTWCVREELVVQVPLSELSADRGDEGWALAGAVPGSPRALVLVFPGPPPSGGRRALGAALEHLASLVSRRTGD